MWKFAVFATCFSMAVAKFDQSLLTEELKHLGATIHKTCADQIGLEDGRIEKLKEGVFEEEADERTKCYIKCVMSESGVMDENGDIDMAAFSEVIPEKIRETTKTHFENCLGHGSGINNLCERAFNIIHCLHDADPENYFFV